MMKSKASRFDETEWQEAMAAAAIGPDKTLSAALQRFVRHYPEWVASRCRRRRGCVEVRGHKGGCVVP